MKGEILTYFSAKGGVGQTLISTNSALMISEKVSTLYIQLSSYPDAHTFFGLTPKSHIYHLIEFLRNDENLDDSVNELCYKQDGLYILLSPDNPIFVQKNKTIDIAEVISVLSTKFEMIIIDLAIDFLEAEAVLRLSDRILTVSNIDPQSIVKTNSLTKKLESEFKSAKKQIILNQVPENVKRGGLTEYIDGDILTLLSYDMESAWDSAAMQMPYIKTHGTLAKRTADFVNKILT